MMCVYTPNFLSFDSLHHWHKALVEYTIHVYLLLPPLATASGTSLIMYSI